MSDQFNINHVSFLWAGPDLAAEIATMHSKLFTPPWSQAEIAKLLEHPGSTALIASHGFPKTTLGFIMSQIAADEAEILSIGVIEEWQRHGVARRLLEAIDRSLQRASVVKVFLEVAEDNAAAVRLYRSAGYEEVGRRPRYYQRTSGEAVDALQMRKSY